MDQNNEEQGCNHYSHPSNSSTGSLSSHKAPHRHLSTFTIDTFVLISYAEHNNGTVKISIHQPLQCHLVRKRFSQTLWTLFPNWWNHRAPASRRSPRCRQSTRLMVLGFLSGLLEISVRAGSPLYYQPAILDSLTNTLFAYILPCTPYWLGGRRMCVDWCGFGRLDTQSGGTSHSK